MIKLISILFFISSSAFAALNVDKIEYFTTNNNLKINSDEIIEIDYDLYTKKINYIETDNDIFYIEVLDKAYLKKSDRNPEKEFILLGIESGG